MKALVAVVLCVCLSVVTADRYHPKATGRFASEAEGAKPRASKINPAEKTAAYWSKIAHDGIQRRLRQDALKKKAKNVVLFLGDGLSIPTQAAARTLLGQRKGFPGEEAELSFESFPTVGLTKTYCVDGQIADSACSATAYLCGVKSNYGTIGVTAAVPVYNCQASSDNAQHLQSIADWALADGRDVGIVTTTRVTHASPAGTYAKVADRAWESNADVLASGADTTRCPDIAYQLMHQHPGDKFKVILGGGRRSFLPNTTTDEEGTPGTRTDRRNLIEEWQQMKAHTNSTYQYIWNRQQLMSLNEDLPEYLLGLFESGHMEYHMLADPVTEPTLAELTEVAIKSLSRNEKGFFLFVEGGRIDHAHHDNKVLLALDETIEFSSAVEKAMELLPEDETLIVVTADHSHVMAFNGYSPRGHDIMGASVDYQDWHDVPYMTLSYTNGPGFRPQVEGVRPNVLNEADYGTAEWMTHVDIPLAWETHGGDDVAVFARGPYHTLFTGLYEQSDIPHRMAYAACFGPGDHACSSAETVLGGPLVLLAGVLYTLFLK